MASPRFLTVPAPHDGSSGSSSIPDIATSAPMFQASPGREWKREKVCFICESPLGRGFSKAKKRECKFCGHAVCSGCSPQKRLHSLTNKPERICSSCDILQPVEDRESLLVPEMSASQRTVERLEGELQITTALKQSFECKLTVAEGRLKDSACEVAGLKAKLQTAEMEIGKEKSKVGELTSVLEHISQNTLQVPTSTDWKSTAESIIQRLCDSQRRPMTSEKAVSALIVVESSSDSEEEQHQEPQYEVQVPQQREKTLQMSQPVTVCIQPLHCSQSDISSVHESESVPEDAVEPKAAVSSPEKENCAECEKLKEENAGLKKMLKKAQEQMKAQSARESKSVIGARTDNACQCLVF